MSIIANGPILVSVEKTQGPFPKQALIWHPQGQTQVFLDPETAKSPSNVFFYAIQKAFNILQNEDVVMLEVCQFFSSLVTSTLFFFFT